MGERDLARLLSAMEPVLMAEPYGYAHLAKGAVVPQMAVFATVQEAEGVTMIAPLAVLEAAGFVGMPPWARITLTVHSDLEAVGLTAAFAGALAARGISANVVAGYFHDHIFVQWARRGDAMAALEALRDV